MGLSWMWKLGVNIWTTKIFIFFLSDEKHEIFSLILQLYRGKLESGIQVVIRSLPLSKKYSIRNFKLRLDLLAKLRHPHLVSLLGHCMDGAVGENNEANVFLIYEYVSNGTFQTYLSGKSILFLSLYYLVTKILSH